MYDLNLTYRQRERLIEHIQGDYEETNEDVELKEALGVLLGELTSDD